MSIFSITFSAFKGEAVSSANLEKHMRALIVVSYMFASLSLALASPSVCAQPDQKGWGVFRTMELPKASGLELEIWFPSTWTVREGLMPQVVMSGSDEPVDGFASTCSLLVRDLAKEMSDPAAFVSRAEAQRSLPAIALREAKTTGVTIDASARSTISDVPSYWFTGTLQVQAGGVQIAQAMYSSLFIYRRWQMNLLCSEGGRSLEEARARFRRSEKTFKSIAASINLLGLWRQ